MTRPTVARIATALAAAALLGACGAEPADQDLCAQYADLKAAVEELRTTPFEPADWPMSVTLAGSPPKAAMFRFTHCSAATWSRNPQLPLAPRPDSFVISGCVRKPRMPTL